MSNKHKDKVTTSPDGVVKDTPIATKRTVKYVFDTKASSATELQIPYAVVVNGEVQSKYRDKPEKLGRRREIDVPVDVGSSVGLYLNSDVHPDHRQNLVYAVTVGENDVLVNVVEKLGKDGDPSAAVGRPELKPGKAVGTMVDVYSAELNGNVWMRISHVYTPEQADALVPSDTAPAIREAVRRIYSGQVGAKLVVQFPSNDGRASDKLTIHFMDEMKANVAENTRSYKFPDDVITRAHPRAFAALLTEARAVGVSAIHVNSAWRPSLGSIAHRAGLGLDINYIEDGKEKTVINREWLTHDKKARISNVTELEKELFADLKRSEVELEKANEQIKKITQELMAESNREKQAALQAELAATEGRRRDNLQMRDKARADWDKERTAHEPKLIQSLRNKLATNSFVSQLLDPWYIDLDTHDKRPGTPNEQKKGMEDLHSNHLHISIDERKISP